MTLHRTAHAGGAAVTGLWEVGIADVAHGQKGGLLWRYLSGCPVVFASSYIKILGLVWSLVDGGPVSKEKNKWHLCISKKKTLYNISILEDLYN